ncbi:MAG: hypothetical protein WC809_09920 [Sinimarinibacterium sp.]|jgi:hypothetical protein
MTDTDPTIDDSDQTAASLDIRDREFHVPWRTIGAQPLRQTAHLRASPSAPSAEKTAQDELAILDLESLCGRQTRAVIPWMDPRVRFTTTGSDTSRRVMVAVTLSGKQRHDNPLPVEIMLRLRGGRCYALLLTPERPCQMFDVELSGENLAQALVRVCVG